SIDIGKFTARIEHGEHIGMRSREVELKVMWHSCGVYDVSYYRPRDAEPHYVIVVEDWYPPDTQVSFTPEQFDKVVELYPSAPRRSRGEAHKPFYEDYDLSRGMFDFEDDCLFQAYKDPHEGVERVYMVDHMFLHGRPTTNTTALGLDMADFQKLKDLIDSKKGEIFYSGCKIAMPSVLLSGLLGGKEE
ncbi:MAG: hypothetical protein ACREGR_04775, partial [Minisyncoccia bacterium]